MTKIVLTVEVPDILREVLDPEALSEVLHEKVEELLEDRASELTQHVWEDEESSNDPDVLIEAWVDRVGGECFLNGNELQVDLNVRIVMRRGPATKTDRAKVGYFVAITDLNRNVLSRQPFETNAAFSSRKTIIFEDVLDLVIPLQPKD